MESQHWPSQREQNIHLLIGLNRGEESGDWNELWRMSWVFIVAMWWWWVSGWNVVEAEVV
jgi:hypothetical protein